ncbi:MAG: OsmC family protein [Betaproteobacteria bacterium]|nr:OsmC family protein [Betaproteobacteria bacterium]
MAEKLRKRIHEIQARLKSRPETAMVSITAASRVVDSEGWLSEIKVRDHTLTGDLPLNFAGTDRGPKPTEYVLVGLATCHEVTYRVVAESLGIPLDGIAVTVTGVSDARGFIGLDDCARPGFVEVRGTVTLDTPASDADVERLRRMVEKHCPVLDALRAPVPVTMEVVNARRRSETSLSSGRS